MQVKIFSKSLPDKGNMAWEYNPFHNYQTSKDLYLDDKGKLYNEQDNNNPRNLYAKAGSLIDFTTDKLNFDLEHPVDIEVLPSYDGSVNLILNDGKNIPRLINSRFSVREKNTYEIVDRIGENDTNIYNSESFDKDTSLYFLYESNPKIKFWLFIPGNLPVGLYCFYLTYCDADDNESDYIGESDLIPVFIGNNGSKFSMDGGIKNQNSTKGIALKVTNILSTYSYVKLYYVRYFADYQLNRVFECKKLIRKIPITGNILDINVNGSEDTEDIDPNILNITRFNPKNVLTSAQCKNMLFFGNIQKMTDNYKELQDISLRIVPTLKIDTIEEDGYYNINNMIDKTGYFNHEYYRFGVVYIYNNGTLSNVYNTIGYTLDDRKEEKLKIPSIYKSNDDEEREYIKVDSTGFISLENDTHNNINSKGVCYINKSDLDSNEILGIKFTVGEKVLKYLKNTLHIRGMFFVRQKCTPKILAQCYLLPMDKVLLAPVLEYCEKDSNEIKHATECFLTQGKISNYDSKRKRVVFLDGRQLYHYYNSRLYEYKSDSSLSKKAYAAICPDFLLNQPYYNLFFNGNTFKLQKVNDKCNLRRDGRFYIQEKGAEELYDPNLKSVRIVSVTEAVPTVAIEDLIYRSNIGEVGEVYRFRCAEIDSQVYDAGTRVPGMYDKGFDVTDEVNEATNLVRGIYSPYLAIYSDSELDTSCIYNIYQNSNLTDRDNYIVRMNSSEPFYAISDRYNFDLLVSETVDKKTLVCWKGDCYINSFTYRLNRNFNDPSLPNNDVIIDVNTWRDNYDVNDQTKWKDINSGDVNAVQIGSWITIKLRSSINYALRSEDNSYVSEKALMGAPRSFYPKSLLLEKGENKLPESYLYNDAYRATLGYKCYFALLDINYLKDYFANRIQYSAVAVLDSFKNNYRYSLSTYFRDYSSEYGGITKLLEYGGNLLVIFEHGIGLATINERILLNQGEGQPVFINTNNVLPEELTIISNTVGTQWGESVIKTEAGFVYGVDTVAKKIWRILRNQLEIISDFKVNKFLVDNITLSERELYPVIGLKNVKTHYNNNKKDVMFTFYDDVYKDEEKVWNLCYNELMGEFITFYSWVPSYSENIDTQFFSFNRDTSKKIALLSKSSYEIKENTGIILNEPIITTKKDENNKVTSFNPVQIYYRSPLFNGEISKGITYDIEKDHWLNYKLFYIKNVISDYDENIGIECKVSEFKNLFGNETLINININNEEFTISKIAKPKKDENSKTEYYDDRCIIKGDLSKIPFTKSKYKDTVKYYYNYKYEVNKTDNNGNNITDDSGNIVKEEVTSEFKFPFENIKCSLIVNDTDTLIEKLKEQEVIILYLTPHKDAENMNEEYKLVTESQYFQPESIALTADYIFNNPEFRVGEDNKKYPAMTTDFYLHGRSGIIDIKTDIRPCFWYGEQHPFEFEFVVNDKAQIQKIFTNLVMISNKATPESFHFEIEGDNYDWSNDKRNMYYRLEATKQTYQNLGSNILFNRKYTDVSKNIYNFDPFTTKSYPCLKKNDKSTIFPLYYNRIDTYNDIYHEYQLMNGGTKFDYQNLSGSEIVWDRDLNQFNIITHIKNSPIDRVGRLRGNSFYKEGSWNIQIPSITYMQKNESDWIGNVPPLILCNIPNDLENLELDGESLPNTYTLGQVSLDNWTYRKETKIRDKWIKIRVRYSGKELAIIQALITLYNLSYA